MSANLKDVQVVQVLGPVFAPNKNLSSSITVSDFMMVAPVIVNGASLVTRNVVDFKNLRLEIVNPFAGE